MFTSEEMKEAILDAQDRMAKIEKWLTDHTSFPNRPLTDESAHELDNPAPEPATEAKGS